MYTEAKYLTVGDQAISVEFGNEISLEANQKVRLLASALSTYRIKGVVEWVPTYRSLLIQYNPLEISWDELRAQIKKLENSSDNQTSVQERLIEIPVCYGFQYGPDIERVAKHNEITVEAVIEKHTAPTYRVYMLGFTPGFPYLGGMDPRLATPRLEVPRTKITAGSVGIAGNQTGIYPVDSPGGWQLIGRTPLKLFNVYSVEPIVLRAGDQLRFVSISQSQYNLIETEIAQGRYDLQIEKISNEG